jgi:hypothetical protein
MEGAVDLLAASHAVGDHGKPQLEGLGDQLIHQGRDHGIHHPSQS